MAVQMVRYRRVYALLVLAVCAVMLFLGYNLLSCREEHYSIPKSVDGDGGVGMREAGVFLKNSSFRVFLRNFLQAYNIINPYELNGRHSDYIVDRPCRINKKKPSQKEIEKFGFVGPFQYLKNYKNPCWVPEGSTKMRCVPYFYLIGTAKAGSTDIYKRIQAHPNVTMGSRKEVMWFQLLRYQRYAGMPIQNFSEFLDVMNGTIDIIQNNVDDKPTSYHGTIIGDGSTDLLMDNRHWTKFLGNEGCQEPRVTVMSHVHHLWPNAKLILVIRNPVTRCLSCYLYFTVWRKEFDSTAAQFDSWVRQSINIWNACISQYTSRHCLYSQDIFRRVDIMQFQYNFYILYLLDLLKLFPRDQIYITSLESYSADKVKTLREIYQFLDLPPLSDATLEEISASTKSNAGKNYGILTEMWPSTQKLLEEFFAPYNDELWKFLGERYPRQW